MRMNRILVMMTLSLLLLTLPAAASDYTLDIFGNANEDETINMQDVTYTELIILEYRDRTELSDAKHDGKINMQDVTQIELVILGKEKELTYLDLIGEAETVHKPIERAAHLGWAAPLVVRALGARDTIVTVPTNQFAQNPSFYPEISKLPIVGSCYPSNCDCDFEKVLSLNVDAVHTNLELAHAIPEGVEMKRILKEKLPGIPLISLNMREQDAIVVNVRTLGYLYDREEEAEEFIDWYEGYYDTLKTRSEGLSDDEKPRAYFESQHKYKCAASGSRLGVAINLAGGKNIIDGVIGPDDSGYGSITNVIDPEWVMEQNPEFIFRRIFDGYEADDPSKQAAAIQEVMDRPELAMSDAVENGRVYTVDDFLVSRGGLNIIGPTYMAKLMHPELFEDIDPQAMHQEFIDEFCYIDYNIYEHGIFVYPQPEES
ncbi:MAG: ABC transporter substrate-binding protein [Euryarchaeota archaeon]|nr:ABC transporter substrate-binding protein [Euryarchaeota archaeon]